MDEVKSGRQLIDFIRLCFDANRPPLLVGGHGVGKSEILAQAAHEMGIGIIVRDLSLMEPPDLIGLPMTKAGTTVYAPPAFLPVEGRGLLVFEELNRCEKYMRAPALQLLTARTLNDYTLPEGWLPAAAVNPADDDRGYEVAEMDLALLSRFTQVRVVPDREEWLIWARASGVHPAVVSYVESDITVFNHPDSNPRSWSYVSSIVWAWEQMRGSRSSLRAAVLGQVGDKRGTAFLAALRGSENVLSPETILTAYDTRQEALRRWIRDGRIDRVQATLNNLLLHLQPVAHYHAARLSPSQWRNLGLFVGDLPGDLVEQARAFFTERNYEVPPVPRGRRGVRV